MSPMEQRGFLPSIVEWIAVQSGSNVLIKLALLACAGALGTLARYLVSGIVQRHAGSAFPWGTFAVNAIGCFFFGLIWALAEERLVISGEVRFLILTGFMGAFTTFSTYAFETEAMLRDAEWFAATGNILAQNGVGFLFVFLGMAAGKLF